MYIYSEPKYELLSFCLKRKSVQNSGKGKKQSQNNDQKSEDDALCFILKSSTDLAYQEIFFSVYYIQKGD